MKLEELRTPAILLDLDALQRNIEVYGAQAKRYGKELWPMVKTHKSLRIAQMQKDAGAKGFLCGTIDEMEALAEAGFDDLMYAYPAADPISTERLAKIAETKHVIARLDSVEAAKALNDAAARHSLVLDYSIIIDCGFHRFGVMPAMAAFLARKCQPLTNLRLVGISSHPGQVYGAQTREEVRKVSAIEKSAMEQALNALRQAGFRLKMVGSGSTPTFFDCASDGNISAFHPGNYVFNDVIQISSGTAKEEDCALQVMATVISNPRKGAFIIDAGAKCLGLDKGAHGNTAIVGHGRVIGHPELELTGLSEEVGQIEARGETDLKIGDRIRIIPNHSCSSANLTGWYAGFKGDEIEEFIAVDMRGNSRKY